LNGAFPYPPLDRDPVPTGCPVATAYSASTHVQHATLPPLSTLASSGSESGPFLLGLRDPQWHSSSISQATGKASNPPSIRLMLFWLLGHSSSYITANVGLFLSTARSPLRPLLRIPSPSRNDTGKVREVFVGPPLPRIRLRDGRPYRKTRGACPGRDCPCHDLDCPRRVETLREGFRSSQFAPFHSRLIRSPMS